MSAGIAARLLAWYGAHHRDLPWRRTRDPYRIWVSEIMLQQTRAQAAIPYYERFLARFPTVAALAAASEAAVLAAWSGLGYYSRARNLHRAARAIVERGRFPADYESLGALPGVGDYTAAAVASIAFGEPHAVVDGNVLRVIARLENDASDIGAPRTRTRFREIAQALLDARHPGRFNQALMELGATVCLPRAPLCGHCPLAAGCRARRAGTAAELPVKLRKAEPRHVEAALVVVERAGRLLLWQRDGRARRLAGFWELPSPEHLPGARLGPALAEFRHTITHHHYRIRVHRASLRRAPAAMRWFAPEALSGLPLSTTARKALRCAGVVIVS